MANRSGLINPIQAGSWGHLLPHSIPCKGIALAGEEDILWALTQTSEMGFGHFRTAAACQQSWERTVGWSCTTESSFLPVYPCIILLLLYSFTACMWLPKKLCFMTLCGLFLGFFLVLAIPFGFFRIVGLIYRN